MQVRERRRSLPPRQVISFLSNPTKKNFTGMSGVFAHIANLDTDADVATFEDVSALLFMVLQVSPGGKPSR